MSRTDAALFELVATALDHLEELARAARLARRLSLRSAAIEIGVAPSTLLRIEAGEDCALSSAVAVLRWIGAATR